MAQKRRGLGRGLGALIPPAPNTRASATDVFFKEAGADKKAVAATDEESNTPAAQGDSGISQAPDVRVSATSNSAADKSRDARGDAASSAPDAATSPAGTGAAEKPGDKSAPQEERAPVADASGEPELAPVPGARFAEVPVELIRPNPRQPRQVFDDDDMAELVHSIGEIGVLQPIVVRSLPEDADARYEIVMGERRWRATQSAGLSAVPAIIKDTTDDDMLRDALLENLHRSQLNPLEEAAAYQQLLDDFGCTHDELAHRIGRSRPQISNMLRLLRLPPLVQRRVAAGVLSAGHARALLGLPDGASMERMAQRIVAEGLSVRTVEELVAMGDGTEERVSRRRRTARRDPDLDDMAARLSDRWDTRVKIDLGRTKGKMTVEFASREDLDRILAMLEAKSD